MQKAPVEAALSASRSQGTYLAVRHARIRARRGEQRAASATAHVILVSAWHMLNDRTPFFERGADYYRRRHNPEAETRRLVRRLETLGHTVQSADTESKPTCRAFGAGSPETTGSRSGPVGGQRGEILTVSPLGGITYSCR